MTNALIAYPDGTMKPAAAWSTKDWSLHVDSLEAQCRALYDVVKAHGLLDEVIHSQIDDRAS